MSLPSELNLELTTSASTSRTCLAVGDVFPSLTELNAAVTKYGQENQKTLGEATFLFLRVKLCLVLGRPLVLTLIIFIDEKFSTCPTDSDKEPLKVTL